MSVAPALQWIPVVCLLMTSLCALGQASTSNPSQANPSQTSPLQSDPSSSGGAGAPLKPRPETMSAQDAEALRVSRLAIVNGRPYEPPTPREQFVDYLKDSYGWPALGRTTVRALYSEARDKPEEWGQDFPGFMQRFGAGAGINAINGNVRYGMEMLFHEDLRYIPCHGCRVKKKIENALLAEITARHDSDGHRFFTLTPTISDFSGPIIAHSIYYPGGVDPAGGAVSARLVFATRIGAHLFTEFVLERRHKDKPAQR